MPEHPQNVPTTDHTASPVTGSGDSPGASGSSRRGFLVLITLALNALIALVVAIPGVRYLLTPLGRKRAEASYTRVAPLSAVRAGVPARFPVISTKQDAFTAYPPAPIGSVWLMRAAADPVGSAPEVRCFQVTCPHLGCGIDYAPDRARFACPCHASDFALDGARIDGPAPRDMDRLACRITPPDEQGERWVEVQYEQFRTGIAEQIALA